jgi:hypothetical protein
VKITKYGTVTLRQGEGPLIEGWEIEREPDDPKDATPGQLLLAYAITWAEEQFNIAKKHAVTDVLRTWLLAARAKATKAN